MANFIAVVYMYLSSPDYVTAIGETDDIKLHNEKEMLTEDGESFEVVGVIEADDKPVPHEQVLRLRQARNILLGMRTQEAYELARAIDEHAHTLSMREVDIGLTRGSYDYSNIMRVVKAVMEGKNPIDY